jgi:hypothetical protein
MDVCYFLYLIIYGLYPCKYIYIWVNSYIYIGKLIQGSWPYSDLEHSAAAEPGKRWLGQLVADRYLWRRRRRCQDFDPVPCVAGREVLLQCVANVLLTCC